MAATTYDRRERVGEGSLLLTAVALVGGYFVIKKVVIPEVVVPEQTKNYLSRIRIELASVKVKGKNVNFDVRIENPNEVPMVIKSIVGAVVVESNDGKTAYPLGNLNKFGNTIVKPNAQTNFPFSVAIRTLPLFTYFSDLLAGKIHGQLLRFNGTININGNDYPVNETFKIA